jgi:putative colanic acid biosynthesis UDP-glucose lipid carrier transferase
MSNKKSDLILKIHLTGDLILLNFSFYIVNSFLTHDLNYVFNEHNLIQFLSLNLFWIASTSILKSYKLYRIMRISAIMNMLIKTCFLHIFIIFSFMAVFRQRPDSLKLFLFKYSLYFILILAWRVLSLYFLKNIRSRGFNYKKIVIAGGEQAGRDLYSFFRTHREYGYKCLGFFDDNEKNKNKIGSIEELEAFAIKNDIDEIYCALTDIDENKIQNLMSFADNNLIKLKILPNLKGIRHQKFEISFYDDIPVLNFRNFPLDITINRIIKRIFDVSFSSLVIILIFPWLFPIIAILIKFSSQGPVFFKQARSGRGNEPFNCYKFRTMRVNAFANQLQATKNDSRITRVGAFLRKTSLDELPQFINVFIGNMSVVGPRPHMLSHTEKYSKEIDNFMVRHFVKAGITGLAQVKGFRGETTDPFQMEERVRYDIYYIENWTFYFDLQIIFITISEIFIGKNKGG